MEEAAKSALRKYAGEISDSNVDPAWLARKLYAAGIIGETDTEKASSDREPKANRRFGLVSTLMGNGGPNVFQRLVEILLAQEDVKWLGEKLKAVQKRKRDKTPDLPTLEKFPHPSGDINIMQEVVPQYKQLGNVLLQSPNGARVLGIEKSKSYDVNDVVYDIFRQWLEEDVDATWSKLVQCLEDARLSPLAQKISSGLI